ncbi:MAG: ribose-5-phosphate isomerase RpiA [Hyphomonadaceae bacterium]
MSVADEAKARAGAAAVQFVRDGMIVGLGTGSTAAHFVRALGAAKLDIACVPTSEATHAQALSVGLKMAPLETIERIDVTIDGADEVDPAFRLIKGAGGALLREKIIASASTRMVVIADESKIVSALGAFPLPVEATPFALELTQRRVEAALRASGCPATGSVVRMAAGARYRTDGGNHVIDCRCERIPDPEGLARRLSDIPGVVEHGLFIGLAKTLVIGGANGVEIRES